MLKHSSEARWLSALALIWLAGCASAPAPAPAPAASAEPVATAATTTQLPAPAPVARPVLPASLQQRMDEAAQLLLAGQKDKALAHYQAVQQAAPEHVSAWLNAALIRREQKDLAAALALIEQCLQHAPNEARALTLKGVVLREQGKVQDAKAAYLAAVAADDGYAPAHRNLAVLADVYLDEPALALKHMERYAALVGDDKQVNSWLNELRRRAQGKTGASP